MVAAVWIGLAAVVALLFWSSAASAAPATEGEFDPQAQLIDLNNLPNGLPLAAQLKVQGVTARTSTGAPQLFIDPAAAPVPPLQPIAVQPSATSAVMVFEFSTPKTEFGLNFRIPFGAQVLLRVFDANGNLLEQAIAAGTEQNHLSRAVSEADFVGIVLSQPGVGIARATVIHTSSSEAPAFDDLLVYPSQDSAVDLSPYLPFLLPGTAQAEKLDAIDSIALLPSPAATAALLDVGKNDADEYAREKALLALSQHIDINALPDLVPIALTDPDPYVGSAARNAVHLIRQQWPMADPPDIQFIGIGPFSPGVPFQVQAIVTSPVNRDRILMRHEFRGELEPAEGDDHKAWQTNAVAGVPLNYTVDLVTNTPGRAEIELVVEVGENLVDYTSYRRKLYFEIDGGGGSASNTIFPGLPPPEDNYLPLENP